MDPIKGLSYATPDENNKGRWKLIEPNKCKVNNLDRQHAIKIAAKLNK